MNLEFWQPRRRRWRSFFFPEKPLIFGLLMSKRDEEFRRLSWLLFLAWQRYKWLEQFN
jgi:hypothetical protein